jgi:hypothetical protein
VLQSWWFDTLVVAFLVVIFVFGWEGKWWYWLIAAPLLFWSLLGQIGIAFFNRG